MSTKKNVFIVGLDEFNKTKLEQLPGAAECAFHPALEIEEMRNVSEFDIQGLLNKAIERMENFSGSVDGVCSYFDFPGTLLAPILAERFGLPGPGLESVMKCEHKYWSRLEQYKVISEHIPQFQAFDPFDDQAFEKFNLLPPFWIKPIKSFRSFLAYRINDVLHFYDVMREVRAQIDFINAPFHQLMETFDLPPEITEMPESCIAESPISGFQCTLEGYVWQGQVRIYGVVDSVRELDRSSFSRYEYPTLLPLEIQHRMIDVARAAIQQVGLDNAPFNVEFFYNQTDDQVYLLEINPRISQAHADMFEKIHGFSHHQIMLDLALGRKPAPMERRGDFAVAGHFMLRVFESGRVTRIPSSEEINRLMKQQPGTLIKISVQPGQHLDELQNQDSYSYEIANIYIGGRDRRDILEKYQQCVEGLSFDFEREEIQLL